MFFQTYNINAQTADSAGTGTAYLTGVKTRIGAIGVDGRAFDCPSTLTSKLDSILKWAHKAGKSVGIVTTTRITHGKLLAIETINLFIRISLFLTLYLNLATPAASYGKIL